MPNYFGNIQHDGQYYLVRKITGVAVKFRGMLFVLNAPKRHGDVLSMILENYPDAPKPIGVPSDQGFVDSNGIFLSRDVAKKIAIASGQINAEGLSRATSNLFSEDLW